MGTPNTPAPTAASVRTDISSSVLKPGWRGFVKRDVPLRPAQWVSVSKSPGFATKQLFRAFAVTGMSHPAFLIGKVNASRSVLAWIRPRCVMKAEFSAAATSRLLTLALSCRAAVAPARFQLNALKHTKSLISLH